MSVSKRKKKQREPVTLPIGKISYEVIGGGVPTHPGYCFLLIIP